MVDTADVIKGAIVSGVCLLNVVMAYCLYLTFNSIVASEAMGAILAYCILFLVLCVIEFYVAIITFGLIIATLD